MWCHQRQSLVSPTKLISSQKLDFFLKKFRGMVLTFSNRLSLCFSCCNLMQSFIHFTYSSFWGNETSVQGLTFHTPWLICTHHVTPQRRKLSLFDDHKFKITHCRKLHLLRMQEEEWKCRYFPHCHLVSIISTKALITAVLFLQHLLPSLSDLTSPLISRSLYGLVSFTKPLCRIWLLKT